MANEETTRRDLLQTFAALPLAVLLSRSREVAAQTAGGSPAKVETKGLTAKIKFESVLSGYLGEHNHAGPGIRQVTSGYMTYVLPDKTLVYGPGDFFFESGDITHTALNKTD